jgi:hypothetical protein
LLLELKMRIIGVAENMKMEKTHIIQRETEKLGLTYVGSISFDPKVEAAIGNPAKLLGTAVGKGIGEMVEAHVLAEK